MLIVYCVSLSYLVHVPIVALPNYTNLPRKIALLQLPWKGQLSSKNDSFLQCGGKNIRFVVMNNLLPSSVKLHEKYDLKGSTYKRKASKAERSKSSPTLKDLDFMNNHPEGILLEKDKYDALIKTIQRDCRVRLPHCLYAVFWKQTLVHVQNFFFWFMWVSLLRILWNH